MCALTIVWCFVIFVQKPVGCDWKIGSDNIEDVCGICGGDGTHCKLVSGVLTETPSLGNTLITNF